MVAVNKKTQALQHMASQCDHLLGKLLVM